MNLRRIIFGFLLCLFLSGLSFAQDENLTVGSSVGTGGVKGKFTKSGKNFIVYSQTHGSSKLYHVNQKSLLQTIQTEVGLNFLGVDEDYFFSQGTVFIPNSSNTELLFQMKSWETGQAVLKLQAKALTLAPAHTEMVVKGNLFDQEYNKLDKLERANSLKFNSPESNRYQELRRKQNTLLTIVSLPEGKEKKILDTQFEIFSVVYHPNGKYLYVLGVTNPTSQYTVKKYETSQWQLIEQFDIKIENFKVSGPMTISPDGSKIAVPEIVFDSDQSYHFQITIFESDHWDKPLCRLLDDGTSNFLFHASGKYISVLSGYPKRLKVYNTYEGKQLLDTPSDFFYDFHPVEPWLVYLQYDNSGNVNVNLVDVLSSKNINSWKFNSLQMQSPPVFDPGGKYLVYTDYKGLQYLDIAKTEQEPAKTSRKSIQKELTRISKVFLHPTGNQIMLQIPEANQCQLLSLNNIVHLKAKNDENGFYYLDKQWKYKIAYRVKENNELQIYLKDYASNELIWEKSVQGVSNVEISPSGKYVVLLGLIQKGNRYFNFYEIRDINTGKLIKKLPANYGTFNIRFGSETEDFLLLNIPKKCNGFRYKNLPIDYFDLDTKNYKPKPTPAFPALVRLPEGKIINCWDFELKDDFPEATQPFFISRGEKIATFVSSRNSSIHEVKIIDSQGSNESPISIPVSEMGVKGVNHFFNLNDDDSLLACSFPGYESVDKELVFTKINIHNGATKLYAKLKDFSLAFYIAEVSPDGKYFFVINTEGSVEIWNLLKSEKLLTIYTTKDGGHLLLTPDGYYHGTKGALENVRFSSKDQSLPFQQYDLKYNRPDIILSRFDESAPGLVALYRKAYEKRMEKMGFDENREVDENHFPEIKVTNASIPPFTDQESFEVSIEASDSKYALNRLNIWVNDVPIFGRNGQSIKGQQGQAFQSSIEVPLTPGENRFRLSVMNEQGVESLFENFSIEYRAPQAPSNLYLISIGVSEYSNAAMNLNYAAKDARDISQLFSGQEGTFQQVFRTELLNKEVTRARIQEIKSVLQQTQPNDAVVLYLSGHGLIDKELDYFLATYDVDFSQPRNKGIPYEELENLLDQIPARKKLILMDACHSGEIDKSSVELIKTQRTTDGEVQFRSYNQTVANKQLGIANSFEMMKELFVDLRRSTGASVISSASGVEFALEGEKWKNGVFTYAMLKGLQEMQADANGDGVVMVSELQQYLATEVPRLTDGQQQPTFRMENISNDWRIW